MSVLSEIGGPPSCETVKDLIKMLAVLVSNRFGDVKNLPFGGDQKPARLLYAHLLQKVGYSHPCRLFESAAELGFAQIGASG